MLLSDALGPAAPEVHVFGDASFQHVVGWGAWAFSIPVFGLEGSGVADAPSVDHVEITAALQAITQVARIDRTSRPLRVHTDSEIAMQLLHHAAKRKPLPERKCFHAVAPLYHQAAEFAAKRQLIAVKVNTSRPEHKDCDRRAAKAMRDALKADPILAWRLALAREEARMQAIVKEQSALRTRLEILEEDALLIQVRIRALNLARPGGINQSAP